MIRQKGTLPPPPQRTCSQAKTGGGGGKYVYQSDVHTRLSLQVYLDVAKQLIALSWYVNFHSTRVLALFLIGWIIKIGKSASATMTICKE